MKPDIWMPFYIGDYLKDTSRLTRDQHGGYLLLIFDYWTSGPLPDDDEQLAAIAKASAEEWRRLRPRLEPFFQVADGVWRHKRVDEERAKATARMERLEQLARAGLEARQKKRPAPKRTNSTTYSAMNSTVDSTIHSAVNSHECEGEGYFTRGVSGLGDGVGVDSWGAAGDGGAVPR